MRETRPAHWGVNITTAILVTVPLCRGVSRMFGLGVYAMLKALVVLAVLAGSLMIDHPRKEELKSLVGKIFREKPMRETKSTYWGINMTTTEIIEAFGYPTETHHVTTSDGYILELHRIPHGINSTKGDRPVAFLQHCFLCASSVYIMNTPDQAIAYVLADAGYDVWMGNFRGNTYSRAHVSLDPENFTFWDFNWDEMAAYDVPTSIDYVLATTGREDLYYVGYSLGTTVFFGVMADLPEYNSKIRAMAALAPVAYSTYTQGLFAAMAPYAEEMDAILTLMGVGELWPGGPAMEYIGVEYCDIDSPYAETCYQVINLFGGPDSDNLNKELLPVYFGHFPEGSSVHTMNHITQVMLSGQFRKYDYGYLGNLNQYGQATPPPYNLSAITAPVGLFWGQTDYVATPTDVAHLAAELSNVALNYRIDKDEFNHFDFAWCKNPYEDVNRHVVDFFAKF